MFVKPSHTACLLTYFPRDVCVEMSSGGILLLRGASNYENKPMITIKQLVHRLGNWVRFHVEPEVGRMRWRKIVSPGERPRCRIKIPLESAFSGGLDITDWAPGGPKMGVGFNTLGASDKQWIHVLSRRLTSTALQIGFPLTIYTCMIQGVVDRYGFANNSHFSFEPHPTRHRPPPIFSA